MDTDEATRKLGEAFRAAGVDESPALRIAKATVVADRYNRATNMFLACGATSLSVHPLLWLDIPLAVFLALGCAAGLGVCGILRMIQARRTDRAYGWPSRRRELAMVADSKETG